MLLILFIGLVSSAFIKPFDRKQIEPSVNNELQIADYTFRFTI